MVITYAEKKDKAKGLGKAFTTDGKKSTISSQPMKVSKNVGEVY